MKYNVGPYSFFSLAGARAFAARRTGATISLRGKQIPLYPRLYAPKIDEVLAFEGKLSSCPSHLRRDVGWISRRAFEIVGRRGRKPAAVLEQAKQEWMQTI